MIYSHTHTDTGYWNLFFFSQEDNSLDLSKSNIDVTMHQALF